MKKAARATFVGALMAAMGILAVGQPAQAEPEPLECTLTLSHTTPVTIGVNTSATADLLVNFLPAEATIVDVDVVVTTSGDVSANDLRMTLLDPGPDPYNTTLFAQGSGLTSDFTNTRFSDESTNGLLSAASDPLLDDYQSLVPLSGWDTATVNRTYRLDVSNYSTTLDGSLDHFSIVLTISGCPDQDGDGVEDWADNCPSDANADQANSDEDVNGNACDNDDDGDGVLDGSDNCPLLSNATQDNLDLDTFGDGCDADVDGDELANELDVCEVLFGATDSGCPENSERSVSLTYANGAFRGRITNASLGPCSAHVPVSVLKVRAGKDSVVGSGVTSGTGKYVLKRPRKAGKYYAIADRVVVSDLAECISEQSPKITLS